MGSLARPVIFPRRGELLKPLPFSGILKSLMDTEKIKPPEKVPPASETSNSNPLNPGFPSAFDFSYDEALESTKMLSIAPKNQLFIGGEFCEPQAPEYFPTINPATGESIADIAQAGAADVDRAVEAANRAYSKTWSKLKPSTRGKYLFRIARMIQERAREFAVLETIDNGKPIKETRDVDLPLVVAHFFYHAGWADKLHYGFPRSSPLGVAAQVIPWNFPLLMAAWKIAPALATGNCVVLKPAETTSLSALLLAEVLQEADLPGGVVNIITGGGATGARLVSHRNVHKVAFTGSTEVGRQIARSLAGTPKKLTLELGGKSAHIIYADAAIDQAVEGVVQGIYFNQGHVCCAGSRLLVEESIAQEVQRKLQGRIEQIRVGNPLDKNTDLGAIHSQVEFQKISNLVGGAKSQGLEYFEGSATELPSRGYFMKPCFFSGVPGSATIFRKEIFGPVLSISTFRTPEEAISKANDTNYGLAAGIWSEKAAKIHKTAGGLKAGVIWANTYNKFDPSSPFGGYLESGFGREGGLHGLRPYLNLEPLPK